MVEFIVFRGLAGTDPGLKEVWSRDHHCVTVRSAATPKLG